MKVLLCLIRNDLRCDSFSPTRHIGHVSRPSQHKPSSLEEFLSHHHHHIRLPGQAPRVEDRVVLFLIFSKVLKRIESGYEDQDTMDSRQTEMPPGGDGDQ